jgi:uncharacterized protein
MKQILFLLTLTLAPTICFADAAAVSALDYSGPAWSPYLVGALIGILGCITRLVSGRSIGASSAYAMLAGLLGKKFIPERTKSLVYFQKNPPSINWGTYFVIAVVIGAFVAALTGSEINAQLVPAMWADRFGPAALPRLATAFVGGCIMALGARIAGGCTSGHGISGTQELSIGSWVSVISFFVGGMIVAFQLF